MLLYEFGFPIGELDFRFTVKRYLTNDGKTVR
jgi:hypothetical protein